MKKIIGVGHATNRDAVMQELAERLPEHTLTPFGTQEIIVEGPDLDDETFYAALQSASRPHQPKELTEWVAEVIAEKKHPEPS